LINANFITNVCANPYAGSDFAIGRMPSPTRTPVAKDFNGDGNADLVLENTSAGQRTIWFLKNGAVSRSSRQTSSGIFLADNDQ
jgi:hypothetical protein